MKKNYGYRTLLNAGKHLIQLTPTIVQPIDVETNYIREGAGAGVGVCSTIESTELQNIYRYRAGWILVD